MSDADAKYRKLAAEYAKLKSHLPVLKKALFDEQQKEEALRDEIKEKGQAIRKSEQELESLVFRNEQLSKRVLVLQDELTKLGSHQNKKRGRADSELNSPQNSSVLNEELQSKIADNERLNKELSQVKIESSTTVMQLKDKIDSLEYSEKQHSDKLSQVTAEHKSQIDKLREDKAILEVRLENQEKSVRESKLAASLAEEKLQHIESEIATELKSAKETIKQKIPFNDSSCQPLNTLNIPVHNRRYQVRVMEQLQKLNVMIRDLMESWSSFFTYLSQRLKIQPSQTAYEPPSHAKIKLCEVLHGAPSVLKPVAELFARLQESQQVDIAITLDTASQLKALSDSFQAFSNYLQKILSYMVLSTREDNSSSMTTQTIAEHNTRTLECMRSFSHAISRVSSHLMLLASQSTDCNIHPKHNQPKMLHLLSDGIAHLHQSSKSLNVAYNRKSELETQLPTAPEALLSTDECLTKSLISATAVLGKLSRFVTENYEDTTASSRMASASLGKLSPMVSDLQSHASAYLKLLHRPASRSVPYEVALENKRTLLSSTESRVSLDEQVKRLNTKATKLEQEKEHWMLEAQLLKIKYDKLQKNKDNRSSAPSSQETSRTPSPPKEEEKTPSNLPSSTSSTELGEVRHEIIAASDDETREALLRAHYDKRIEDLTMQLQTADGKAVAFHAECRALGRRLEQATKMRGRAVEELEAANSQITQLQDELMTTKKSYDAQLMTMSEALASMNGNLAGQQDEIEELKLQLKNARRGKR